MFKKRVISGIFLVIIIAVMNFAGGLLMDLILLVTSVIGLLEFYRAVSVHSNDNKKNAFEIIGVIGTVIYYVTGYMTQLSSSGTERLKKLSDPSVSMEYQMPVIVFVFVIMMGAYVFLFPRYEGKTVMSAFFGFVYIPVMLHFIFMTRVMYHGEYFVWLIYIVSWVCDTAAYCVGMLIGKHKLAPVLSPKKTIEGAIGGIAGSTIVSFIFALVLFNKGFISDAPIWLFTVIGALGAIVSQIGDLAASAFKRNYDIKDYGNLIPGHGGILDRFDSVIFSAPMIYILATMLGRIIK